MNAVQIWRCTECDKWSHAKRKPRRHLRLVVDPEDVPADKIARWEYSANPEYADAAWVHCGPFEEWRAVRFDPARVMGAQP